MIQIGYWQVDNCALSVSLWTPDCSLESQELQSAATWAILKSVPPQLYSLDGISVIASGIGDPLHTENSRLPPFHFGDTKVKVEINLDVLPPTAVIVRDSQGFTVRVPVAYPRLPPQCSNCSRFGHTIKYCLHPVTKKAQSKQPAHSSPPREAQVSVKDDSLILAPCVADQEPPLEEMATELEDGEIPASADEAPLVKQIAPSSQTQQLSAKRSKNMKPGTSKTIGHRSDPSKRLTLAVSPATQLTPLKETDKGGASKDPETPVLWFSNSKDLPTAKSAECVDDKGFIPAPATLRKARRMARREACIAKSSPTFAVSSMFSSIRGLSLGGLGRRH